MCDIVTGARVRTDMIPDLGWRMRLQDPSCACSAKQLASRQIAHEVRRTCGPSNNTELTENTSSAETIPGLAHRSRCAEGRRRQKDEGRRQQSSHVGWCCRLDDSHCCLDAWDCQSGGRWRAVRSGCSEGLSVATESSSMARP